MKSVFLALLCATLTSTYAGDERYTVTGSGPRTVRLLFRTTPDGKPYLPVTVCGRARILFLDTGGTTLLDLQFAKSLGLNPKLSGDVAVGITGVTGPRYVAKVDFEIGKMKIKGLPVNCLDLSAMRRANRNQGLPEFDGLIGSDLLAILRARIDYDSMKLTIRRPKS